MHFRKLQLESFRSHVKTALDLAPLTVIRGANSSGKSSVEQALQLVLGGRADATTADGKGSEALIRAGSSKAAITLAIVEDGVERIVKMRLNGGGKARAVVRPDDPQYCGGSDYLDSLTLSREVLSCLCNNRYFVDLKEDEQRDVLARIVLPKTYQWPEWVKPLANSLGLKVNWNLVPFEIIGAAYDAAFKERTGDTRDLKNLRMPEGDSSESKQELLDEFSRQDVKLRGELEAVKKRKYEMDASSRHAATTLKAAQDRLATATARLSREQQELSTIEGVVLTGAKLKDAEKLAKNAAKVEAADKEIARLDAEIAANKAAYAAVNDLSTKPRCPTCQSPVTDEVVAFIAGPIMARRNELAAQHRDAVELRKSLGNPAEAAAALAARAKAQTDTKRAQERIREEQTAIRDAEAAIATYEGISEADMSEVDAQITELGALLEVATTAMVRIRAAMELAARKEEAQRHLDELTRKQRDLNRLVAYFGEEVLTELLAKCIGPFLAAMNGVLMTWGYQAELQMQPYRLGIVFGASGSSVSLPLSCVSKSQRYRFGVAFQVALAVTTGYKFVVVDEADILDPQARGGLFKALTTGVLDQAIILGTDVRESVPNVSDAIFYRLDDVAAPGAVPTTAVRRLMPDVEVAA